MRYLFLLMAIITTLSQCKVMHNSQKERVCEFAQIAKTVADVPSDIYTKYYELNHTFKMYNSATDFFDTRKITDAVKNLEEKQSDISADDSKIQAFKTQYGILRRFASLLLALNDKGVEDDFCKNKQEFVSSFQSLRKNYNNLFPSDPIPKSLTSLVGTLVEEIGKRSIRYMQRKYLVRLMTEAEQPFNAICDFYINKHSKEIDKLCERLPAETVHAFSMYLQNIKTDSLGGSNLILYQDRMLPLYLGWQAKVKVVTALARNQKLSMQKLKTAYAALQKALQSHASFKETMPEVLSLADSYYNIKDAYSCYSDEVKKIRATKNDNNDK